jgi:uncharacterized protein YukJ
MNSFKDQSIFNQINTDAIQPKEKKPLPFPLENVEEDIAECYSLVFRIHHKLKTAQLNPVNDTSARTKRLKSLLYKTKTCMKLLKDISAASAELWF